MSSQSESGKRRTCTAASGMRSPIALKERYLKAGVLAYTFTACGEQCSMLLSHAAGCHKVSINEGPEANVQRLMLLLLLCMPVAVFSA